MHDEFEAPEAIDAEVLGRACETSGHGLNLITEATPEFAVVRDSKFLRPAVALMAAVVLTSCGGDGSLPTKERQTASAGPAEAVQYGSVTELKDAAVQAGYVCPNWVVDNAVKLAAESGSCGDDSVISTYASGADLQSQLDVEKATSDLLIENDIETTPVLVGPNWLFKAPEATELRESLGGVLIGSKE